MLYVNAKLPDTIITIHLGQFTTTRQTSDVAGSLRWTVHRNDRVTRGGNIRSTHYPVSSYPVVIAIKLANGVINLPVAGQPARRSIKR